MAEKSKDIEAIYNAVLTKESEAERSAYLDGACGDDLVVRARVEALIKAHEQAGDFLKVPVVDPKVTLDKPAQIEGPGMIVGRYKLLEEIGEGGMAAVYMAEQKHPIRRKVAFKIIKLGMDTKEVLARFEAERQALAMMDHPNVAKVLDAGATDTGRPYFVMELVRGASITEYCDKNKLGTRQRLELFIPVCKAIQHAHHKGIIHRDLKPSNIMVTLHDGKPVPMVIDFGVAKATNQQLTEKTVFTRFAQMIGTPEYMSPEQAEMSGLDIDARTDIYSLGVLLYELLTGTTPFGSEQLRQAGYAEMQRIIRETEPLKPSTKLSTLGQTLTDIAQQRHTSPEMLSRLVRGDLDWIVMKTLEKDRTRRYETAHALGEDVERYLRDEPITAGRPSVLVRCRKFMRRNRALVASTIIILAVLVVGTIVSALLAIGQSRARAEAEDARADAEQAQVEAERARTDAEFHLGIKEDMMAYFQMGLLAQGMEATVGEVLDTISKNIEQYTGSLQAKATYRQMVGNMYVGLGLYEKAEPLLESASKLFQEEFGSEHSLTIAARRDLAYLYSKQQKHGKALEILKKYASLENLTSKSAKDHFRAIMALVYAYDTAGNYDQAIAFVEPILENITRIMGEEHELTVDTQYQLGRLYHRSGKHDKAEKLLKKVMRVPCPQHGYLCPQILDATSRLARISSRKGQYDEAEQLYVKAVEEYRQASGEEHPDTLKMMYDFAEFYLEQYRYEEAAELLEKVVNIRRRVLGEEHLDTLRSMCRLSYAYKRSGRTDKAKPLIINGLENARHVFGDEHWLTLWYMRSLGDYYKREKRYAEAEQMLVEAVEINRRVHGEESVNTLVAMCGDLAEFYCWQGNYDKAGEPLIKGLETSRTVHGEESWMTLQIIPTLAWWYYYQQGLYDEAEQLYVKLLEIERRLKGEKHPRVLDCICGLGFVYYKQGRYDKAEEMLDKGLQASRRLLGENNWLTLCFMRGIGLVRCGQGRYDEAQALLVSTHEIRNRVLGKDDRETLESKNDLAVLYKEKGDYDKAEPLFIQTIKGRRLKLGDTHPHTLESWNNLIDLYEAWGESEEAKKWRAKLPPKPDAQEQ